ncbi:tRNA (adenosine(37)-N6)-threonylcarbamoyltransferase complex ATPase subunit type 1 TsaE [Thiohalobacter sp. IOR34]|uniref:tRNA (adenosine(37)-N6)-threonylcarbamoyltransferase complex ATPase subunit type 1 TsaE n=1 Tax=Thiohalobacter sp. IOR34 TaxID=3057176 RepID=UPI0025B24EF0|nr:tRNA (adenosine(37)-N6)-threonylcarbamoyltransferase complex ATPase subunit type 1 TsaE [Thiohalobacter sp. IOR34]WJW74825.1 tRNA (adenosine(37)-N6)-threonylcarbamoyltransferase complex ATPase subunit type 1 TsaE [Thiohalobacter sp. IOR34]
MNPPEAAAGGAVLEREIRGEAAMEAFGARLAAVLPPGSRVYLAGELGAGKTTLVRGLLRGLGYRGRVKSPTYALVEPYEIDGRPVYHLDLYRLSDPEELEWIGIRELFADDALCLIEWPERGAGVLPPADLHIEIRHAGEARRLRLAAGSARGVELLRALAAGYPRES